MGYVVQNESLNGREYLTILLPLDAAWHWASSGDA